MCHKTKGAYHLKQNSSGCDRCIMVSDFLKIPTNRMRWRLPFNFKNNRRSVPLGRFIRAWKRKFLQMVRKFPMEISFGNCRVPPEFPNGIVGQYLAIRLQTKISGFFGQMVSTPKPKQIILDNRKRQTTQ